ncbi:MAG: flagellar assembly peptidoglycan hydrolase FlgJ [Gammaproteobacteria bacterium]|nr:flagellar assembly peptidoglycan hydrolase FlgJ [Gammaproteobacteria bacterium]
MSISSTAPGDALKGFAYSEVNSLARIKRSGDEGIKAAAQQFESLFIDLVLKSAREANATLAPDSYMSSDEGKWHQEMLDHQWSVHLAERGGVGLAKVVEAQMSGEGVLRRRPERNQPDVVVGAIIDRDPHPVIDDREQGSLLRAHAELANVGVVAFGSKEATADSPRSFIERVLPTLRRALAGTPLNPVAVLAQAALETGWGRHVIHAASGGSSHNLFGIKAGSGWNGDAVSVSTVEFSGGRPVTVADKFRAYPDLEAAIKDYAALLTGNSRYSAAVANAQDPERFADELQKAGYATDPGYAAKIRAVLGSPALSQLRSIMGL